MRRLLATSLIVVALLASTGPALADHVIARPLATACPANQVSPTPFADVATGSPFELAISCLGDYEITRGRTATSYAPAGTVLRQQMAQFLYRLGSRAGVQWDTSDAGFTDLSGLAPEAREAVNALANAGVAQGRSADRFDPGGVVTRGQMASFLARLADATGAQGFDSAGSAFDDDEELVHEPNIDRIAAAGVTTGRGGDRFFDPFSPVTREQMAAFLARTLDVLVDQRLAPSRYRDDVAPFAVTLDQQGRLVDAGSALTGSVRGDRLTRAQLSSPCVGSVDVAGQFTVPTDRQSPVGRCPVTVSATFDNGRSSAEQLFVVMPGYTERPELVHVERVGTSSASGFDTSEVRFLFDEHVTLREPAFGLETYDDAHGATGARQDGSHAVIATFGTRERPVGAIELLQVSRAGAGAVAVVDADGEQALSSSALLNPGSSSLQAHTGPTWGADLLSVTHRRPDPARPGAFLVDFLFDERLPLREAYDYGADLRHLFDVVLVDGSSRRCTPQQDVPRQRTTVSCDAADGPGGEVARGVHSRTYPDAEAPLSASLLSRRLTAAPDLVQAQWGPAPDQATLVFDEPVQASDPTRFEAKGPRDHLAGNGHRVEVSAADPRRVVVTLQGPSLDQNTLLIARGGAVTSRATGRASTFDHLPVPARNPEVLPAGQTQGTDLLDVTIDENGVAHYDFDTYFFPSELGQLHADLRLYTPDGTELRCDGVGYDNQDYPYAYSTDLQCGSFTVEDPDLGPDRRPTAEEVRSAVVGFGEGRIRVVTGARRP